MITSIRRDWGIGPSMVRITTTSSTSQIIVADYMTAQADNITAANSGPFTFLIGDALAFSCSNGTGVYQFVGDDFSTVVPSANEVSGSVVYKDATNTLTSAASMDFNKVTATEGAGAVTINSAAGTIITSNLTTPAGTSYTFTMTNSFMKSSSNVFLSNGAAGTNTQEAFTWKVTSVDGSAVIHIANISPTAAAMNGTLSIRFNIF